MSENKEMPIRTIWGFIMILVLAVILSLIFTSPLLYAVLLNIQTERDLDYFRHNKKWKQK